jgi:hypothetical protein
MFVLQSKLGFNDELPFDPRTARVVRHAGEGLGRQLSRHEHRHRHASSVREQGYVNIRHVRQ